MEYAAPEVNVGFDGGSSFRHKAPEMPAPPRQPLSPAARRRLTGQRAGVAIFSCVFAGATLWWTFQILSAVWGSAPPSAAGCADGTAKLQQAVERARDTYARGAGDEDERTALSRYRGALEPEWSQEKGIAAACRGKVPGEKHLRDVIALRYAEEHAVRYESLGLAPIRRRLQGTNESPNDLNR